MKKVRKKLMSWLMVVAFVFSSFSSFVPMTVYADTIDSISATIEAPVDGQSPATTVVSSEPSKYTAEVKQTEGSYDWFKGGTIGHVGTRMAADEKFVAGENYVVRIGFTPEEDYTFDLAHLTAKLNDQVGDHNSHNGATHYYEFEFVAAEAPIQHTVTFDAQDGSSPTFVKVNDNEPVDRPTDPEYGSLKFGKWYKDNGGDNDAGYTYDFSKPVTEDITLKAYWEYYLTAIAYPSESGLVTTGNNFAGATNEKTGSWSGFTKDKDGYLVGFEKKANEGYKFKEWRVGSPEGEAVGTDNTADYFTNINGNITVKQRSTNSNTVFYAIFEPENVSQYTVTFINAVDNTTISTTPVNAGDKVTRPSVPTMSGYTFDDWYEDAFCTTKFDFANTAITLDTTIYAKFIPNAVIPTTHTVTFLNADGTTFSTEMVNDGETVARPTTDPTITGYKFIDWFQYSSGTYSSTPFDFSTPITSDITILAKSRNVFYINFDINGGNFTTDVEDGEYSYREVIRRQDYEGSAKNTSFIIPPTNKEFDYLEINGTKWTEDTYTVTDDVIIKIIWKDKAVTPTYTIESGDGQSFTLGDTNDIVIKASGDLDKLTEIKVDGITLDSSNYTTAEGSTILTLLNSYLNTLSVGNHTVTFVYRDGSVDATLKVLAAQNQSGNNSTTTDDNTNVNKTTGSATNSNTTTGTTNASNNPKTGDNIVSYIIALLLSITGLAGASVYVNRKKLFNK